MTDTIITHQWQKIVVTEVTDVQVTEITTQGGMSYRAIRVYGTPTGENIGPVLEVHINSPEAANLKVTTPELDF